MRLFLAAALAVLLPACAPLVAQSPGHGLSPVNAVATIKSVYQDVTFRFANAGHKALFDSSPEKYIPQTWRSPTSTGTRK